jgi:uncharacterized phage protein (TIGR01671 family)
MREIKFRAWDKQNNCWGDLNQLSDWGTADITACIGFGNEQYPYQTFRIESDTQYEIQQFTGLFDRNGKEVYEGDVLTTGLKSRNAIKKVYVETMEDGEWKFRATNENYITSWREVGGLEGLEVIGNIFENKELLK